MVSQNGFPIVLGLLHIVACLWRHGAGEEVWSLIRIGATPAHTRRRDLALSFAFPLLVVLVPRRYLPHCYGKCPIHVNSEIRL